MGIDEGFHVVPWVQVALWICSGNKGSLDNRVRDSEPMVSLGQGEDITGFINVNMGGETTVVFGLSQKECLCARGDTLWGQEPRMCPFKG